MTPRYKYVLAKARMLHRELSLPGPPVDIEAIIHSKGIQLTYFFTPNFDAGTIMYAGKYYIIIRPFSLTRNRWSMAHEFAHIYLEHFKFEPQIITETNEFSRIGGMLELSPEEHRVLDREANVFARELLMPAGWVKSAIGNKINRNTIRHVRKLFDVSWEAAIIRLDELGIMSREEADRWLNNKPDF